MKKIIFLFFAIAVSGCSGLKVMNPNEKDNSGTLALDVNGGSMKLVSTYTCRLESMGNRFAAVGKTEDEARQEVIARCQDRTLISNCNAANAKCGKN